MGQPRRMRPNPLIALHLRVVGYDPTLHPLNLRPFLVRQGGDAAMLNNHRVRFPRSVLSRVLFLAAGAFLTACSACIRDKYPCTNPRLFAQPRILAEVGRGEAFSVALDASGNAHLAQQSIIGGISQWHYIRAGHFNAAPLKSIADWPADAEAAKVFPICNSNEGGAASGVACIFAFRNREGRVAFTSVAENGTWTQYPLPPFEKAALPDRVFHLGAGAFEAWWMPATLWEGISWRRPLPEDSILVLVYEDGAWRQESIPLFHDKIAAEHDWLFYLSWRDIAAEKLNAGVVGISIATNRRKGFPGTKDGLGVFFSRYDRESETWISIERIEEFLWFERINHVVFVPCDGDTTTFHVVAFRRHHLVGDARNGVLSADWDYYLVSLELASDGSIRNKRTVRLQEYVSGHVVVFGGWQITHDDAGSLLVLWFRGAKWYTTLDKWAMVQGDDVASCGYVNRSSFRFGAKPWDQIFGSIMNDKRAAVVWGKTCEPAFSFEPPLTIYYAVRPR